MDCRAIAERVAILHEQVDDGSRIVQLDDEALFIEAINSDSLLIELDPLGRAWVDVVGIRQKKATEGHGYDKVSLDSRVV